MLRLRLQGLLICGFLLASCGQNPSAAPREESNDNRIDFQDVSDTESAILTQNRAQSNWSSGAAKALQNYYGSNALFSDGWWQTANAITALADYMRLSGNRDYIWILEKTFNTHKGSGFINDYFDDGGWWGLAWIRAYDLTGDWKYMEAAIRIADDMYNTGWDNTCKGGIWWHRNKQTKNAVENALYIKLAAAIHNRLSGDTWYLGLATKTWNWFYASGLVDDRSIVSDKLINCVKENMSPAWTYNQGIILGAAVELHKATGNVGYLDQAKKTAYGAMQYVTSGGILIEATDSSCGACTGDERLFKGAFMRNLREFYGARKDETIGNFLRNNANSAYNKARTSDNYYGFRWNGPYDRKDAGRQTSALDLMNAMIVL